MTEGSKIKLGEAIDIQSAQLDLWKEFDSILLPQDESFGDTSSSNV
jgi:hypothetical protein